VTIPYVYDAGALIAIDDNDRRMWTRHHLAVEEGRTIHIPSVVVGQVWRDARRQVRLGKFLAGCKIEPVGLEASKAAGVLCGKAQTNDIVDAVVIVIAATVGAIIWTSDPRDIKALAAESNAKRSIVVCAV
jgi:hypothetical protein